MVLVKMACDKCGPRTISSGNVTVLISTMDAAHMARAACPICKKEIVQQIPPHQLSDLLANCPVGVLAVPPSPENHEEAPALTWDDALDFHNELSDLDHWPDDCA